MARPDLISLRRRLSGAPTAFVVRIAGRGLAFLAAIVTARALGVEQYGVYAYAIAWTAVLLAPSMLGFNTLLVRYIPTYRARGDPSRVRGLVRHAHRVVTPLALGLAAAAALVAGLTVDRTYLVALLIALPIVPIRAVTSISVGVLQALHRPDLSFVPVFIVFPAGMIVGVGALTLLGVSIGAELAVTIAVGATALGLAVGARSARRFLRPVTAGVEIRSDVPEWRRALGPLTAVAVIVAASAQVGLIMLGAIGTPAEVGVFQAASKLAEPVGLVFLAVTVATAPRLATLHELGNRDGLSAAARRAARASLYYSLPLAAVVVAGQGPLLGFFGSGFESGGAALTILVGAQVLNAFAGSVGNVLLMTGHGAAVAWTRGGALTLNVLLCIALIPPLGIEGAAVASAVDTVVWNALLAVVVWRRLGINATALPWPRRRPSAAGAPREALVDPSSER